jgi:hypothetical protein
MPQVGDNQGKECRSVPDGRQSCKPACFKSVKVWLPGSHLAQGSVPMLMPVFVYVCCVILVLDAVRVSAHFDALRSVLFDAAARSCGEGSKVNSTRDQR